MSPSTASCTFANLGKPVLIMNDTDTIITGTATQKTIDSLGLIENAMISAPIIIPGALSSILIIMLIIVCICVTSFVSLVTSEPVENLSMFVNENAWILP